MKGTLVLKRLVVVAIIFYDVLCFLNRCFPEIAEITCVVGRMSSNKEFPYRRIHARVAKTDCDRFQFSMSMADKETRSQQIMLIEIKHDRGIIKRYFSSTKNNCPYVVSGFTKRYSSGHLNGIDLIVVSDL